MAFASKSPWVIHYDGSSCNGCDIEVLATLCPGFDGERFGVVNTGNPKHADIFLVTGSVNEQNIDVVREIYDQMVEPKVVVACGICACTGGIFHDCYNVIGGVDKAIPVDVYAPGCAVRPEALIDAIVQGVAVLDQKAQALKEQKKGAYPHMTQFSQVFKPLELEALSEEVRPRKEQGWRYVQTLAVNKDDGVDLIYSFMKDGLLENLLISDVARDAEVPSITEHFLEAFVFENEIHDLFGVKVTGIAIDFGGNFYRLATKEPMTVISPEQRAAREKARKIAEAKAAKEAKAAAAAAANTEYVAAHPSAKEPAPAGKILDPAALGDMEEKLAGMDPEKVARVKAAMAAKAKRAAAQEKAAQNAEAPRKEGE